MWVKPGDLVKTRKGIDQLGFVVEIFADLDKNNPWVRVLFTHPVETYRWCKKEGLIVIQQKEGDQYDPPLIGAGSESGSL
jgi:hypothetical protein